MCPPPQNREVYMLQKAKTKVLPIVLVLACLVGVVGSTMSASGANTTSGDTHYQIVNEPVHQVYFYKEDSYDGSHLAGATFRVTGTANDGTEVDTTATSDTTGKVLFSLKPGTYTLVETEAPDGYALDNTSHVVAVSEGSDYFTISAMEKDEIYGERAYYTTDVPEANGHVKVTKVWDDGTDTSDLSLEDLTVALRAKIKRADYSYYNVTFYGNGGYFGSDSTNTSNSVRYAWEDMDGNITKAPVNGTYTTPTKSGYIFMGWSTSPSATSASYTISSAGVPSFQINDDLTLYAVWKTPIYANYVVQIYGINQDGVNTITFGPALGTVAAWYHGAHAFETDDDGNAITMTAANFPNLESSSFETAIADTGYKNYLVYNTGITHDPDKTGHCIHNDTWDEIVANISAGKGEEYYGDCLKYGCTATVQFEENGITIKDPNTGNLPYVYANGHTASYNGYVAWNPSNADNTGAAYGGIYGTIAGGWSASYIRAFMNGADEYTTEDPANYNLQSYAALNVTGTNGKTGTAIATQVIDANGNALVTQNTSLYGALIAGTPALGNGHIKKRTVRSIDKLNNSADTTTSNSEIDETSDYLWLFSDAEMWNASYSSTDVVTDYRYPEEVSFVNSSESTYQRTINMPSSSETSGYSFTDQEVTLERRLFNACGSGCWLWLRSPYYNNSYRARIVGDSGGYSYDICYFYDRCAPGFVVG